MLVVAHAKLGHHPAHRLGTVAESPDKLELK